MRIDGTKTVVEDHHIPLDACNTFASDTKVPIKTENLEMNVMGNNFSILAVHVKAANSKSTGVSQCYHAKSDSSCKVKKVSKNGCVFKLKRKSRRSIIGFFNPDNTRGNRSSMSGPGSISPSFLRPLRPAPATPGKSCLKKFSRYSDVDAANATGSDDDCCNNSKLERSPLTDLYENQNLSNILHPTGNGIREINKPTFLLPSQHVQPPSLAQTSPVSLTHATTVTATKKVMNICFSPFNAVRIIAHRIEEGSSEEDDDDDDLMVYDDEDDEDDYEEDDGHI